MRSFKSFFRVFLLLGLLVAPALKGDIALAQGDRLPLGAGSGVIVDAARGHVLTNYHTAAGTRDIVVTLADNRRVSAQVIASDPVANFALLKIDARELDARASDAVAGPGIGEYVVTVGNRFDESLTVAGHDATYVSNLAPDMRAALALAKTDGVAAVRPIVHRPADPIGIAGVGKIVEIDDQSFGAPPETLNVIEVVKGGNVVVLTVVPDGADLPLAARVDSFKRNRDGPANLIPFQPSDGTAHRGPTKLIPARPSGTRVAHRGPTDLIPSRQGYTEATLRDQPAGLNSSPTLVTGVMLRDRPGANGVVVDSVESGGAAWQDGLRRADVIASANRIRVGNTAALESALASAGPTVVLEVRRNGRQEVVVLRR